jgi:hypothetical protein
MFSTLLQKPFRKKQETEECVLKLCGYIYHQGTYTRQAGTEKGVDFLPFTGVRKKSQYITDRTIRPIIQVYPLQGDNYEFIFSRNTC